jgi:hypothetical protein
VLPSTMKFAILVIFSALLSLSCAESFLSVVDISNFGFDNLSRFKSTLDTQHNSEWWIEVGDKLLVFSDFRGTATTIQRTNEPIFIVPKVHVSYTAGLENKILLHHWGFAIIQAQEKAILDVLIPAGCISVKQMFDFNYTNTILVQLVSNTKVEEVNQIGASGLQAVPIQTLVDFVSQSRWFSDVTTLAQWNRFTRGTQIANAQKWITDQLSTLPNLTITTQPFTSGATSGVNVIATLRGTVTPNKIVIIGAHYDSTSQSTATAAPGAEDDASGSAAVLEMARVFSRYPPTSTVMFMFFSGEEQGMLGSAVTAQQFVTQGNASKVALMHDMDMIAYQIQAGTQYSGVLLETTSAWSNSLFPIYRLSATRYTTIAQIATTTSASGSDHVSFLNRGMPALLTIDKDWASYPYYHRTTDTPDKLVQALGYQIVRLGVGAVAQVLDYPL